MQTPLYIPSSCFAKKIAQRFGTPTFITDNATIVKRIKTLRKAFTTKTKIYYAIKANYNPAIVKIMRKNGIDGIDATSPFEIKLAKKSGFSAKQIIFTGNNSSTQDLRTVYQEKVLPNIGSLSELRRWGEMFPGTPLSLRINPGSGGGEFKELITSGKHVKFGIKKTELEKARVIIKRYNLNIIGLHFHLGSGLYNTKKFTPAIKVICGLALTFKNLQFIDVGGGFGVRYHPKEKPLDSKIFFTSIEKYLYKLEKELGHTIEIRIEPGKFLVAESTCLLTKIITIRKNKNLTIVGVDTSLNHIIRPSLYGAYHHMIKVPRTLPLTKVNVVGNICESTDVLGTNILLGKPREGDLIAILTAGAYCSSMSSLYNLRPYAAEVLVTKKNYRLIKKKLSFNKVIANLGFKENSR
jgi:diaminopimelate decarboxylase